MKQVFLIILTISLLITALVASLSNSKAFAQCTTFYGQPCPGLTIAVNKMVQNPKTNTFVDNLGINDPKFQAEQIVTFHLTVTNTSNGAIPQVIVRDTFAQFTSFVFGPGNFDTNSKVLTFELTSLQVGESRTFTVQGKVVSENQLPTNMGITCPVNQVNATTNQGQTASDTAQFCIERRVLGAGPNVTQIPAAGVEPIYLLAFAPIGLFGIILRKKAFSL